MRRQTAVAWRQLTMWQSWLIIYAPWGPGNVFVTTAQNAEDAERNFTRYWEEFETNRPPPAHLVAPRT